jgi:hypothetical protein
MRGLLTRLGIDVNVCAPYDATPDDLARLTDADFNVVMYPEVAGLAAAWLERTHRMPRTTVVPIGRGATIEFIRQVAQFAQVDCRAAAGVAGLALALVLAVGRRHLPDRQARVRLRRRHPRDRRRPRGRQEMGFEVVGLGTYSREFAREVREAAAKYGVEALITDDYLEVEARIAELQPELVLGTQMERHIAKRLGLPCAVISAPVHVQDFPARYSPQMGFRRRERAVRHLGAPADDGPGRAPAAHVPRRLRVPRVVGAVAPGLGGAPRAAGRGRCCPPSPTVACGRAAPACRPNSPGSAGRAEALAATSNGGSRARRAGPVDPRRREGTEEDPVLRARQGPSQHRAYAPANSAWPRASPSRPSTMPRRTSAADASGRWPRRPPCRGRSGPRVARAPRATRRLRVVLVTMDSHLASAASAPAASRASCPASASPRMPPTSGAATSSALERCKADIAQGDIVIVTMLFLEDHFQPLLPVLKARRDHCDAMVCAMSAGEVTKLTRMGKFDMSAPASGPDGAAEEAARQGQRDGRQRRRERRQGHRRREADAHAAPPAQDPALHPRAAQDVRAYFLTLQYWLAGSEANVGRMVHFLVDRYADGPRRSLRGMLKTPSRWNTPELGVYHPRMEPRLSERAADLPRVRHRGAPARWACCCCARTCWPATPATTTA